ncbi:DNA topoisomerase [Gluconobacter albidus]|uniref:Topo IA-type catalytic domain-containing protein n=2 Tax=Gluconobacter albidus TaxID=318683 RepID=A0ABQ5X1T9_9PROT|nr:DNA topoisomerase [Gluconobacter albidus]GBQ82630.1 hypothetical protein AA3250_0062 [Gluconobacter albidus NBRC 3250]GLQ69791.1 hypothetical protein GCM10007866_22440 [Gluconobacter albidus]
MTDNNSAHPPITPTDPEMTPARVSGRLSPEEFALYEIAYRAMRAAQAPMPVVELGEATYTVDDVSPADRMPCAEQGLCEVLVTTASVLSDGWWEELPDAKESFLSAMTAPDTDAGLRDAAAHPDVRFVATPRLRRAEPWTLDELLLAMAGNGVGRPSTFHGVLELMAEKRLLVWDRETRQICLTQAGLDAALTLEEEAPDISSIEFVACLEQLVDQVSTGNLPPHEALRTVVALLEGETFARRVETKLWQNVDDVLAAQDTEEPGGLLTMPGMGRA